MKKTIAILLVLVIGMVGVFAVSVYGAYANDGDDTLTLTTTIAGRFGLKIATAAVAGDTTGAKITSFLGLTSKTNVPFTEEDLTETLNVNYMNNQKGTMTISTTIAPLVASVTVGEVTSEVDSLGYTVNVGSTSYTVNDTTPSATVTFLTTPVTGMTIGAVPFTVTIASEDWLNAAADELYTTTWTVNLSVN